MKTIWKLSRLPLLLSVALSAAFLGRARAEIATQPVLADIRDLQALDIPMLAQDPVSGVAYARLTPEMQERLQARAHQVGKCGGFEALNEEIALSSLNPFAALSQLQQHVQAEAAYERAPFNLMTLDKKPEIQTALDEVSEANLRAMVTWLSSFPNRYNAGSTPNAHIDGMKAKLEEILKSGRVPYEISTIDHQSTRQKSIRVRLIGSERPDEIIVMGAHLDSINQSWMGGNDAPGADDNASGSSNLVEALRILAQKDQPQRSIEIFWYAGEESGLLGSAEIAKTYKSQNKNVIAVLQLDMTLFPGAGAFVLGNMTDFTSSWLRDYLRSMNDTYLHVQLTEDKCGYGCSDHASWFRQGYPTLMPFEATMRTMNPNIHTSRDIVSPEMNFKHSMVYSKIALVFALDLANSTAHQLY